MNRGAAQGVRQIVGRGQIVQNVVDGSPNLLFLSKHVGETLKGVKHSDYLILFKIYFGYYALENGQ